MTWRFRVPVRPEKERRAWADGEADLCGKRGAHLQESSQAGAEEENIS